MGVGVVLAIGLATGDAALGGAVAPGLGCGGVSVPVNRVLLKE